MVKKTILTRYCPVLFCYLDRHNDECRYCQKHCGERQSVCPKKEDT